MHTIQRHGYAGEHPRRDVHPHARGRCGGELVVRGHDECVAQRHLERAGVCVVEEDLLRRDDLTIESPCHQDWDGMKRPT